MDACALEAITDIDMLRQMVREQRDCIAERDTRLAERDATIATNQRTLCERDALIKERGQVHLGLCEECGQPHLQALGFF